jgi:uncharacterized protein YidB (DUF937 family)
MPREHDTDLERVVMAALRGSSSIAVLVGGSSTGKTRACWEALNLLRDRKPGWQLWHPIDPSRPEAALRELGSIGPRTVVWLNEAQFYLDVAASGLGERIAAGLRELLRDPARAPVLVLATLWPQFWDRLTVRPSASTADPHAQARDLLSGRDISVPAAFTPTQLQHLTQAEDPRLVQAAKASQDGQVIQFLAGAPELLTRYRNASSAATALINAAIDARRLGVGIELPLTFLGAAAPGYLTDAEWDDLAEDWLEQALAYTAAPCKGIRGPLAHVRLRPPRSAASTSVTTYRLADYLDQHGRRSRSSVIPPAGFWAAATWFADPGNVGALAKAAEARGLLCDAARMYKRAAVHGDTWAAAAVVKLLHSLHPLDKRPAKWSIDHAALDDLSAVGKLLDTLRETGARDLVEVLGARAAVHAVLDDPRGVAWLLNALWKVGASDQVTALLARNPAAHAAFDVPWDVASLLRALLEAGAGDQVAVLLARDPATHVPLTDPSGVGTLLEALRKAGADDQVKGLGTRAAAQTTLNDPHPVAWLLIKLRSVGAHDQVANLLARDPATHVMLDTPFNVALLLGTLRQSGVDDQFKILGARAAAQVPLDDLAVAWVLHVLHKGDARDQVATLLARDPANHSAIDEPFAVAWLLDALREVGARDQVAALLARDPANHVSLNNPHGDALLLDALQAVDADDQVAALLARDPATYVTLDHSFETVLFMDALQKANADDQVGTLIARLPAEGLFALFCEQADHPAGYLFGREPDGSPASSWDWDDL